MEICISNVKLYAVLKLFRKEKIKSREVFFSLNAWWIFYSQMYCVSPMGEMKIYFNGSWELNVRVFIPNDLRPVFFDWCSFISCSYENTDLALHYGSMLRECIRHQSVARWFIIVRIYRSMMYEISVLPAVHCSWRWKILSLSHITAVLSLLYPPFLFMHSSDF